MAEVILLLENSSECDGAVSVSVDIDYIYVSIRISQNQFNIVNMRLQFDGSFSKGFYEVFSSQIVEDGLLSKKSGAVSTEWSLN